jgi:hypothetical protein
LIRDTAGQKRWAEILTAPFQAALARVMI